MAETLPIPLLLEDDESQAPALQTLMLMGWEYLASAEATRLRNGRRSNVILDGILEERLRRLNRIRYRGDEIPFSQANIAAAIQAFKDVLYDGLIRTNEKIYDLQSADPAPHHDFFFSQRQRIQRHNKCRFTSLN
jgi:type I restriction enzyme R subunit